MLGRFGDELFSGSLGIYRGLSGHRTVDTSLAMWIGMIVSYNGEWIIDYFPSEDQWWITGFNPKYQNVSASNLRVTMELGLIVLGCIRHLRIRGAEIRGGHSMTILT